MSIRHAILGLLWDGPLHGYELKSLYEKELVPNGKLNFGQVYTTLERLQRDGLVGNALVAQAERPDKKVYRLTDPGRDAIREWVATPTGQSLDLRNETFLKLILARRLDGVNALDVLRVEQRACFDRLHEVTQARARADKDHESLETRLLLELAELKLQAFMKWLTRCEEAIREESP